MADPYLASNEFPGDGVTTLYNISFKGNRPDAGSGVVPYLSAADVKAQVITPATATMAESVVDVPIVYVGPNQFTVTPATPVGKITRIYRATQDEYALVDYQALQTVGEADLDLSNRQVIFVVQEAHDLAARSAITASDASEIAASAVLIASGAVTTADEALDAAAMANAVAASAVATANSASGVASAAVATANTALTNANAAVTTANGIAATANTALANSAAAVSTANGIAGTANTALTNANAAVTTANTANTNANAAVATANGIATTANTALTNANAAVTTANTANSTASTANATANAVAGTANTALTNANAAVTTANTALSTATSNQPGDALLTAIAALVTSANQMMYTTGVDTVALTTVTAAARGLLDDANTAAMVATLGLTTAGGTNILLNGSFNVNQRAYASGTAVGGAGQYTFDRWRVVVSGQNVTYSASGLGNIITAPAGGVEQEILGEEIQGGTYVINWTGTATCAINGSAVAKGGTVTLPALTNAIVRFSSGTVYEAQLEYGSVSTAYQRRGYNEELNLCKYFYQRVLNPFRIVCYNGIANTTMSAYSIIHKMRTAPVAAAGGLSSANASAISMSGSTANAIQVAWTSGIVGNVTVSYSTVSLDAEL